MKNKALHAIAQAAANNIKSEADLNELRQMLTKITVETALNAELDEHLGFSRHEQAERTIIATATHARPCRQKMVSSS